MDSGKTILIIDDEPILIETIAYNLEKEGFNILKAFDGESGLVQARGARPDLVILDLMLPKLTGWEVCRALHQNPSEPFHAPILMLTARGEEADRVKSLALGADDYLVKPFAMRELITRVHALLNQHEPEKSP